MHDTPTKVFGVMCVFVAIWIAVYWLYDPGEPPVTFDRAGAPVSGQPGQRSAPAPLAELAPSLERETPDPTLPTTREPVAAPPPVPAAMPGGGAKAATARVVPPEFWEYVVQTGDTGFEMIAQRVYADRSLWKAVSQANPLVTPNKLIPGRTRLRIPVDPANIQGVVVEVDAPSTGEAAKPAPAPEATSAGATIEYTIKPEDTLSGIAKSFYGKAGQWRRIFDANRDVLSDPDSLPQGAKIRIPPQ